ncbi:MAG: efflux RND transporter periplasmic adaptor subunit [Vicinamibacterales bacterium]
MRRVVVMLVCAAALGGGVWYYQSGSNAAPAPGDAPVAGAAAAGGARGARGGGRASMAVETAVASRHDVVDFVTVVGNLIGEATVDVVPRVAGRLDTVNVKLGDRVTKGQLLAKVEDREVREQVNQSQANLEVNRATILARESDVKVAESALQRAKTSFDKGLVSRQALEDADSRYSSALAQVAVAKAQQQSTQARLDELKVNLANTSLLSPVDGFVGKRNLDPGGFAGGNTVVFSVVDIGTVRLIANLVEKDFKRIETGNAALVEVDAFPGEQFSGQVSRVSPVFDPATRTATMEIEIPNRAFRLKPGMYARVRLTADHRVNALTVPRGAIVDVAGKRGVYVVDGEVARFQEVRTGISDADRYEIVDGLDEGAHIVTLGSLALRDGDRIALPAAGGRGGRGGRGDAQPKGTGATPTPNATPKATRGGGA